MPPHTLHTLQGVRRAGRGAPLARRPCPLGDTARRGFESSIAHTPTESRALSRGRPGAMAPRFALVRQGTPAAGGASRIPQSPVSGLENRFYDIPFRFPYAA